MGYISFQEYVQHRDGQQKNEFVDKMSFMAKPFIGLAHGAVSGAVGTVADVVHKVAGSIMLGPEAAQYFNKDELYSCLNVIAEYLADLGTAEERVAVLDNLQQVTQYHLKDKGEEEKSSVGWQVASRTVMPVVRGLGAAANGIFQTLRKMYAYSDPIANKRHNRTGEKVRSDYEGCLKKFAQLLVSMKEKDREKFFQRFKKEAAYLQNPTWGNWFGKKFG